MTVLLFQYILDGFFFSICIFLLYIYRFSKFEHEYRMSCVRLLFFSHSFCSWSNSVFVGNNFAFFLSLTLSSSAHVSRYHRCSAQRFKIENLNDHFTAQLELRNCQCKRYCIYSCTVFNEKSDQSSITSQQMDGYGLGSTTKNSLIYNLFLVQVDTIKYRTSIVCPTFRTNAYELLFFFFILFFFVYVCRKGVFFLHFISNREPNVICVIFLFTSFCIRIEEERESNLVRVEVFIVKIVSNWVSGMVHMVILTFNKGIFFFRRCPYIDYYRTNIVSIIELERVLHY